MLLEPGSGGTNGAVWWPKMHFAYTSGPTSAAGKPNDVESLARTVLPLRWLLIITTSYLVVFSWPLGQNPALAALFVAAYFASNLILPTLLQQFRSPYTFGMVVVVFDAVMVSIGLALAGNPSSQFYVVYFLVIFLSALSERFGLVVGAAILVSALHLYTESRLLGPEVFWDRAHLLRVPFLLVVAMFFGHLVQDSRSRERSTQAARARERRMKSLSGISHDVKNPLGIIQSLATLLLDGDAGALNEGQADLVRRIHANTRYVITLALNLIDAARIDAGHLALQRRPVDFGDVVEDSLLLARSAADIKKVALDCYIEPGLPIAHVDVVQIERVIANVVGNAIKFTPTGGRVTVSVRCSTDAIVLTVADNGPGIAPGEIESVFEIYRRNTRGAGTDGSGLGLFIVKAIVEAHGGTVGISSMIGQGTTVTITLPRAPRELLQLAGGPVHEAPRRWWWPFGTHAQVPPHPTDSPVRALS